MENAYRPSHHEALPATPPAAEAKFLTFEPRGQRQEEAARLIESGVEKLLADPNSYFRFAAKFHQYSLNNTLLIMSQKPDATQCASRDRWLAMKRTIKPEEKYNGIGVFYPKFRYVTETDPDTGQEVTSRRLSGFGMGNTFDISQTEGEPLPKRPNVVEELGVTDPAKEIDRRISSYLIGEQVKLMKLPMGQARGAFSASHNLVALNTVTQFGDILTTKTLLHEAAHWAETHTPTGDRQDDETIAEAAAAITMYHFDMNTGDYSHVYLAEWAENMDRLRSNLGAAQKVATRLITAIEGERPENMADWS